MLKSRITERITPKFRPFPTNTYQHIPTQIQANTYQHKNSTKTYQHTPKLWPFYTNTYPPNDLFSPHLFRQPKESSSRVATHLSPKTAPGKWVASSLSSCSLQWQLQGSKSVASAPESAPCHARRFHHQATEKIYTCVQPDTQ